jgi:putative flippase GtrA
MVTFKAHDEKIVNQMTKFFLVFVVSVVIASGIGHVIMTIYHSLKIEIFTVQQAQTLARLMSIGLTTLFNYPAIKFFSFRRIRIGSK